MVLTLTGANTIVALTFSRLNMARLMRITRPWIEVVVVTSVVVVRRVVSVHITGIVVVRLRILNVGGGRHGAN